MQVDRTGTDSIKEAAFVFGYGHTVIAISPPFPSLPLLELVSLGAQKNG